ncbi:MAG: tRNA lysidine(34) synthetase TilS [Pelagimonas sp.]|uniref:tRNA lysidine(34) synthetase TilS n=1 Tax=Pelagimonas sp. TaxID=2073170 RepID=UPI003D6BC1F0
MTKDLPNLDQRFAEAMGQLLGPDFPSDIALAVSGGGDSMAMLALAHNWTRVWGVKLWVVTVDHGLRAASADEAAMVANECKSLGHPHATLRWHWDGKGNLQDAARAARLHLINRWRGDLDHVLVAHTQDDLAETFLMRLKRGSGVEGLAAMRARRVFRSSGDMMPLGTADCTGDMPPRSDPHHAGGVRSGSSYQILRPCLSMRRQELRHYNRVLKTPWADDPSNDDLKYDRVRMRRLLGELEPQGFGADLLAETAHRLRRAQEALAQRARHVWSAIGTEGQTDHAVTGDLLLNRDGLAKIERDTQLRLLAAALQWVSSASYRPREAALEELLERGLAGGGGTLHGCELRVEKENLRIFREEKALTHLAIPLKHQQIWDGRWLISPIGDQPCTLRALGDAGWQHVAEKKETPIPYHAARSLPSLWQGDKLLACRALGIGPNHPISLNPFGQSGHSFDRFLLSH